MSTDSTKSGSSQSENGLRVGLLRARLRLSDVQDIPEQAWRIGAIVIFLIAAVLRFYNLNLCHFITMKA